MQKKPTCLALAATEALAALTREAADSVHARAAVEAVITDVQQRALVNVCHTKACPGL